MYFTISGNNQTIDLYSDKIDVHKTLFGREIQIYTFFNCYSEKIIFYKILIIKIFADCLIINYCFLITSLPDR